ncbi:MAG: S-layer homology domain-containing protein [Nitriliruptor sp.]
MSSRPARRFGVLPLVAALILTLAPAATASAADGSADSLGERRSASDRSDRSDRSVRATADEEGIQPRDLTFACPDGQVPDAGFDDAAASSFAGHVDCLVWYGITTGTTADTYSPHAAITRRQAAVFLHNLLDDLVPLPQPPSTSRFDDVAADDGFGRAINVLASDELADLLEVWIVSGTSADTFHPYRRITRAQMGSMVHRTLLGVANYYDAAVDTGDCGDPAQPDQGCFPDEDTIPAAHRASVASIYRFGIVSGFVDGTFGPNRFVSRGQMAVFVTRLLDIFVEAEFTLPPGSYVTLLVDRGTAGAPCVPTGADGSDERPYCTIQPAIDEARTRSGLVVTVVVVGREARPYVESLVLSAGNAREVSLAGVWAGTGDDRPEIRGTVRVTGDDPDVWNELYGLIVEGPSSGPAVDVTSRGNVWVELVTVEGAVGIRVDQGSGRTFLYDAYVDATDVGVDVVSTDLGSTGTDIEDSLIVGGATAYVRLPDAGAASTAAADRWADTALTRNGFGSDIEIVTVTGRRVIRAAG